MGPMRLFALWVLFLALFAGEALAQSSFYETPAGAGAPGTIIAQEDMPGAAEGASATRVLYRSTGLHGEAIAVSGVIIVPAGQPPAGGWPVIAWAHPTSGVVPRCAPSMAHFFFRQVQGLKEMLDEGYVVAATDYPGLGTPGPHPYLVGVSEARAVLDSVRAARALANTSDRFAVWGHSQGGQASLFTGLLAKSYAPELQLVGVAAAAPATDLKTLLSDDIATAGGRNLTAMTFYSWSRVFDAPIDTIVDASAMPAMDALSNECIENIFDIIERHYTEGPLAKAFLANPAFASIKPWSDLLAQNTPGTLPSGIPVFLSQGPADGLVRPTVTQAYFKSLCRGGSSVTLDLLPGVTHAYAAKKSAQSAIAWITDRFNGASPPSDC
jgi:acetyl esterase/lipase